jgi:hypothetical protein
MLLQACVSSRQVIGRHLPLPLPLTLPLRFKEFVELEGRDINDNDWQIFLSKLACLTI